MIDRSLMFSVLMSLKPQYCQRILDGVKTVEIRKTIPTRSLHLRCICTAQKIREQMTF